MATQYKEFIDTIRTSKFSGFNAIEYANGGQEIYLSFQSLLKWIGENVNLFSNNQEIIKVDWKSNKPMFLYTTSVSCNLQKCYIQNRHIGNTLGTYSQSRVNIAPFQSIQHFTETETKYTYTSNINTSEDTLSMQPMVGNINYIYLNIAYLSETLIRESSNEDGKVSIRKYLQVVCNGVNKALGSINDLQVISDVDGFEEFVTIVDYNQKRINGLFENNYITQIQAQGLGSMLTNIKTESSITPEIADMISIGAQAQGQAVGVEAVSFSRLSAGLEDRVYPTKRLGLQQTEELEQKEAKKAQKLKEEIESNYQDALQAYSNIIANQIPEDANDLFSPVLLTSTDTTDLENTPVELYKAALAKFTETGQASTAFIPIKLDFSLYGMSGMKIYQKFKLSNDVLPISYKGNFEFQTMGVSHTVDSSAWNTTITSLITLADKKILKEEELGMLGINIPSPLPRSTNPTPLTLGETFGSPFQTKTANLFYTQGIENQTRNQPLRDDIFNIINQAAKDNSLIVEIFSAGQDVSGPQRTGSSRHNNGYAADIWMYTENNYFSSSTPTKLKTNDGSKDEEKMKKFSQSLLKHGIHSIGAGNGYMNDVGIHVDIAIGQPKVPNARYFGKDKTTGKTKTVGAAKWLSKLMANANSKYPVKAYK